MKTYDTSGRMITTSPARCPDAGMHPVRHRRPERLSGSGRLPANPLQFVTSCTRCFRAGAGGETLNPVPERTP